MSEQTYDAKPRRTTKPIREETPEVVELPKPKPIDTKETIRALVKSAPLWDSNATAQGMTTFGAKYKAWLQGLRRISE